MKYSLTNQYGDKIQEVNGIKAAIKAAEQYFQCSVEESEKDLKSELKMMQFGWLTCCLDSNIRITVEAT